MIPFFVIDMINSVDIRRQNNCDNSNFVNYEARYPSQKSLEYNYKIIFSSSYVAKLYLEETITYTLEFVRTVLYIHVYICIYMYYEYMLHIQTLFYLYTETYTYRYYQKYTYNTNICIL